MKRRRAMHWLRKMINNDAIAYMLTYFEKDTDLRRDCVRIVRKYRPFMTADNVMFVDPKPDPTKPDNMLNFVHFKDLRSRQPIMCRFLHCYPTVVKTVVENEVKTKDCECRTLTFTSNKYVSDEVDKIANEYIKNYYSLNSISNNAE